MAKTTPGRRATILRAIGDFGCGEMAVGVRTLDALLREAMPGKLRGDWPFGDDRRVTVHSVVLEVLVQESGHRAGSRSIDDRLAYGLMSAKEAAAEMEAAHA